MCNYGYIRVSTREQNEDRQVIVITEAGVEANHIYIDKQSGKDFNCQQYKRLFRRIHEGDTLFVKSIDRLGRNYDEILEQWRMLTKEKGINIVVLDIRQRQAEGIAAAKLRGVIFGRRPKAVPPVLPDVLWCQVIVAITAVRTRTRSLACTAGTAR